MAYSTLLSLEKTIDQILDPNRFSISPHERKQIISLDKYVIFFQAFLEDFPEKAMILEVRIRDVAAEAEDIIEWFLSKQIRYSYGYTKRISIVRGIMFKYQLHKVSNEMESIALEVGEIQNSITIKDNKLGDSVGANSSAQVAEAGEIIMVGFNEDLMEIKEKLCGRAPQLQVLSIFGMGGIGKTTLARNAYDDQLVMEHFQIRVWVLVSQDYSQRRILLNLLDSMKEFDPNWGNDFTVEISKQVNEAKISELSNSEMAEKVHKVLMGRRFLIVMDDIWSTKVLDDVKHLFPNDNNRSRIMLTTRLTEVARYENSSILPHEMRLLDADRSWNLLKQKVFGNKDYVPRVLESLGREIARSCGGLPLAIVVMAGLLCTTSNTLTSWEDVATNIRSSLDTADGQIDKIMSLSYSHLPHRLRPCFLYMGGFPEDHEIKVTQLIRLWIAESFVKPVAYTEFEVTAEEYLEDLVSRSLVVVTKRKPNGKIKSCSLHDMVREMCIKLSREEKFLVQVKGSGALKLLKGMKDQRRISICDSDIYHLAELNRSNICTIIYFKDELGSFGSFRFLRVLDLLRARYQPCLLSDLFFELLHLSYLAFCNSNPIPRAISNLQSLETLIIKEINNLCLPYEIWNMRQLRHLIVSDSRLANTSDDTSALKNLQTLGVKNLKCSVTMLTLIPNLTKLRLNYSMRSGELLFHNLIHLSRLEKLHLELGYSWFDPGQPNLVVPSSLKKLTLIGWGNEEPYLHIAGPFPSLEVLKLKNFCFMQQVWRTSDENFPQLGFLLIEESDIRIWETESSHFPRLRALHIRTCVDLIEIPDCLGETLELIELKFCSDSLANSAKRIQEEAQSSGNDVFQVRCTDCEAIGEPLPSPPLTPPPQSPSPSARIPHHRGLVSVVRIVGWRENYGGGVEHV